jgi:catechol 2,3-dioxygenase-like lactoylglutathione lyase family enzyme
VFDHVTLRVSDRAATERFYETVLPAIGVEGRHAGGPSTLFGNFELSVTPATEERPMTTGLHIGLCAPSVEAINSFWERGTAAGYESDGEPGPRPQYGADYYGAFLLDPDGNSIEAVRHGRMRSRGLIDHLWMRTTDIAAARDYYRLFAAQAALDITADELELIRVRSPRGGSLTITTGEQSTCGVHIAVPATTEQIDAWHAAMTDAGYPSDGAPGPRPYHPSYYGAFVLDPDGHSTELVDHGGLLGDRS